LVDKLRNVRDHHDNEYYVLPALLRGFLEEDAQLLASRLEDPARLLDLYLDILGEPRERFNEWARPLCFDRIAENPAPLPIRQRYMLRILEEYAENYGPEAFVPLVTGEVVPRLREIAFNKPIGTKDYHASALYLLAEYGDLETARRLRERWKEQGVDEALINRAGGYVWMIESQHHPDMLLDHIRSGEWIDYNTRVWALRRAVALNLDKSKLRDALLEHAGRVDSDPRLRASVEELSKLAVQNGILKPGELLTAVEENSKSKGD
jgi:hypothetical protein